MERHYITIYWEERRVSVFSENPAELRIVEAVGEGDPVPLSEVKTDVNGGYRRDGIIWPEVDEVR